MESIKSKIVRAFCARMESISAMPLKIGDTTAKYKGLAIAGIYESAADRVISQMYGKTQRKFELTVEFVFDEGVDNKIINANEMAASLIFDAFHVNNRFENTFNNLADALDIPNFRFDYPQANHKNVKLYMTFPIRYSNKIGNPFE